MAEAKKIDFEDPVFIFEDTSKIQSLSLKMKMRRPSLPLMRASAMRLPAASNRSEKSASSCRSGFVFTQRELSDLSRIVGHIANDDEDAASRFGNALLNHVDLLGRFPRMGTVVGERTQVRKLVHSPILAY
jgi:plasmid stabilization system protein ParE